MVSDNIEPGIAQHLEERGEFEVRLSLSSGTFYPADRSGEAIRWLAEKDAEAARQALAWRTQEALTASTQNKTQMLVNIVLIVIASVGVIVGLLAWWLPRH